MLISGTYLEYLCLSMSWTFPRYKILILVLALQLSGLCTESWMRLCLLGRRSAVPRPQTEWNWLCVSVHVANWIGTKVTSATQLRHGIVFSC